MAVRFDMRWAAMAFGLALAMAGVSVAAPRPQTTPLAEAQLFISPCGQVYRSQPGEPYPVVAWFKAVDTNHDGKIDRAEFKAEAETFFHQLDLRKNGIVDDEIISLYERRVVPEILQEWIGASLLGSGDARLILVQSGASGGRSPIEPIVPGPPVDGPSDIPRADGPPRGAAPYGLLNDAEPIRSADHNFTSRLKLADFLAQADRNFDALDRDGRGYLTLEDLPRTPAQKVAAVARKR